MAEACVVMRPRQDQLFTPGKPPLSPHADNSLITSTVRKRKVDTGDSPLPPPALLLDEGKRQRTPPVDLCPALELCTGDAVVRVAAAPLKQQPPVRGGEAQQQAQQQQAQQQQQAGACQAGRGGGHAGEQGCADRLLDPVADGAGEGVLFSPLFHLHKEGTPEGLAAPATATAPPPPRAQQPAEQAATDHSTDHSTGTSASLSGSEPSDSADAEAQAAMAGCSLAGATSPGPAAAPPPPEDECGEEYLEFDPLLFIKRLPPLERCVPPARDPLLPRKTRRSKQKTLVLDLDETLVHSTLDGYCRPDFTFPVEVGATRHLVSVRQRPHLHAFLERVAALFEVVVFTASQRVYAEQLLNVVDPQRRLVRHRLYREACVLWEGNYLKDLTVLGRDLAHTVIVDNSPQAFGFQLDNGVPIESWYDDDGDAELLRLLPFLERLAAADDVRPHIQKRFGLRSVVDAMLDPDALPAEAQAE